MLLQNYSFFQSNAIDLKISLWSDRYPRINIMRICSSEQHFILGLSHTTTDERSEQSKGCLLTSFCVGPLRLSDFSRAVATVLQETLFFVLPSLFTKVINLHTAVSFVRATCYVFVKPTSLTNYLENKCVNPLSDRSTVFYLIRFCGSIWYESNYNLRMRVFHLHSHTPIITLRESDSN